MPIFKQVNTVDIALSKRLKITGLLKVSARVDISIPQWGLADVRISISLQTQAG